MTQKEIKRAYAKKLRACSQDDVRAFQELKDAFDSARSFAASAIADKTPTLETEYDISFPNIPIETPQSSLENVAPQIYVPLTEEGPDVTTGTTLLGQPQDYLQQLLFTESPDIIALFFHELETCALDQIERLNSNILSFFMLNKDFISPLISIRYINYLESIAALNFHGNLQQEIDYFSTHYSVLSFELYHLDNFESYVRFRTNLTALISNGEYLQAQTLLHENRPTFWDFHHELEAFDIILILLLDKKKKLSMQLFSTLYPRCQAGLLINPTHILFVLIYTYFLTYQYEFFSIFHLKSITNKKVVLEPGFEFSVDVVAITKLHWLEKTPIFMGMITCLVHHFDTFSEKEKVAFRPFLQPVHNPEFNVSKTLRIIFAVLSIIVLIIIIYDLIISL